MASLRRETEFRSFSRAYLESFTSQELINVAAQLSVDIQENLSNRTLIIDEILDAVDERIALEPAEGKTPRSEAALPLFPKGKGRHSNKTNPFHSVKIPVRYNITYIKALVRDPLWIFAFWEIKEPLREKLMQTDDFEGFFLRISAVEKEAVISSYSVPVGPGDKAWYLDFPPEGDRFFVEICMRQNGAEETLARTRLFHQPKILPAHGAAEYPAAVLSGIRDMPILREKNRKTAR
jgi:hypothetical protein